MKNRYLIILIILVILILLCKMSFIERFVDYVIAQYDNNKYKVQKYPNQLQAANTLAKINEKVNKLEILGWAYMNNYLICFFQI